MQTRTAGLCISLVVAFAATLAPIASALAAPLIISEYRVRGPAGANDEFIEIYNNSGAAHTVAASTGTGYGIAASDGVLRCSIPNGTLIPAGGHFLCANSMAYGLTAYAAADATYTTDIPDNAGIALFDNNAGGGSFVLANRMDAAGSTSEANTLYKEGAGSPALTPFSIDYAWVRDVCGKGGAVNLLTQCTSFSGESIDTDDNAADFYFVDTNGTSAGGGQRLGAPGPENLASPVGSSGTSVLANAPFDSCDDALVAGSTNFVRDFTSVPAQNSTFGTIAIRRTFTNTSGAPLTALRFRIVDIDTFPAASGFADLRPRTVADAVVSVDRPPCGAGTSNATASGTTLDTTPSQPNGGGFNSTLEVPAVTPGTPLANGASIDINFLFGIQQTGDFRVALTPEGLPVGSGPNDLIFLECNTETDCATPNVSSIVRANTNPNASVSVDFTVTFNQNVTGVDASDFSLTTTGAIAGASITGVAGSGAVYTVTVDTGTGDGTIRLDVSDDDSISNATFMKLGDNGAGNGNFTTGQAYTISKTGVTLSFSQASFGAGESAGNATITVIRNGDTSGAIGVDIASTAGTATAADFTPASTTLSWAAGETAAKTFVVPITQDALVEGDETVNLTLSNPTGGANLGSPSSAVLTIVDNDDVVSTFGSLGFGAATFSIDEGGGTAIIPVVRSGGSSGAVSVTITSSNGTAGAADFTAASTVLNWADGDNGVKTLSVPITQDALVEGNESVALTLTAPGGGAVLGSPSTAILSIVDDDTASNTFGSLGFGSANFAVAEGGGSVVISVIRSGGSTGAVSVDIASTAGTATAADFTPASTTLNWADGETGIKTITVPILNDTLTEGNETVNLTLTNAGGGALLGSPSTAVLTIVDNPQVPVIVDNGGAMSPWLVLWGLMLGLMGPALRRKVQNV